MNTLWEKIKKILTKRRVGLHVFSLFGFFLTGFMIFLPIFLYDSFKRYVQHLDNIEASLNMDSISQYIYVSKWHDLSYYANGLIIVFWGYFIMSYVAILLLKSKMKNGKIVLEKQGRSIYIKNLSLPKWNWFTILVDVVMENKTAACELDAPKYQTVGIFQDNEVIVSMKHIPYGVYRVKYVDFYLKDPLQIFNTMVSRSDLDNTIVQAPKWSNEPNKLTKIQDVDVDSIDTIFMSDATESYFSTREYRRGDSLKRIHWKNSAKTGKFVVRVPEDTPIKPKNEKIVLNLYVPKLRGFDISRFMGTYLETVVYELRTMMVENSGDFQLFVNGGQRKVLKDLDQIESPKLGEVIINEAVAEKQIELINFLKINNLPEDTIVFTPSWDIPTIEFNNTYVFSPKELRGKTFKEWVNEGLQKTTITKHQFYKFRISKRRSMGIIRKDLKELRKFDKKKNLNSKWVVASV